MPWLYAHVVGLIDRAFKARSEHEDRLVWGSGFTAVFRRHACDACVEYHFEFNLSGDAIHSARAFSAADPGQTIASTDGNSYVGIEGVDDASEFFEYALVNVDPHGPYKMPFEEFDTVEVEWFRGLDELC